MINVFEILSNFGLVIRVCSGYVQGMFRVCSGYVQGMFRVCSEYVWYINIGISIGITIGTSIGILSGIIIIMLFMFFQRI